MVSSTAQVLIDQFKLQPHPEGGFYIQMHQSRLQVQRLDHTQAQRAAQTSIYFLMTPTEFSAFHRLKSEEIWCFHQGWPVRMIWLNAQTKQIGVAILGHPFQHQDANWQVTIPAHTWFAAEIISSDPADLVDEQAYALMTCVVSPGFDFIDFELADRDMLQKEFPDAASDIQRLTRRATSVEK